MHSAAASRLSHHSYEPAVVLPRLHPFACREDAPAYRTPAGGDAIGSNPSADTPSADVPSPTDASAYPVERSLRQADALALSLRAGLARITIPLARAAAAFVQRQAWSDFGFARLEDFTRERFGRSARWVKDLASVGRAFQSLPALADALTGDDGGRPIGRVAALLVARIASADSLPAWVALARGVPIRALRESVREARAAGSDWPPDDPNSPSDDRKAPSDDPASPLDADADDLSDRSLVSIPVPSPVLAAFDEVVDLYRCVEGREATVTSFVEALVGEACSAGLPPDADSQPMKVSPDPAVMETALARSTDNWSHLPATSPASWSLALAGVSLVRLHDVESVAGTGGAAELEAQIRALLALEDDLDGRLAKVLADMAERGAWPRLRFAGVGHYAEERLGVSRTSAEDRVRAVRSLRQFPLLRAAAEAGRIGFEATLLILRILGRGPVPPDIERAWLARAEEATVKRLRDEARALGRTRSLRAAEMAGSPHAPAHPSPLDDAAWHASLRREPGTARDRVLRFGAWAAERPSPDVFLRLRLPHEIAADFLGVVETARQRLSALADSVPWDEPWPDPDAAPSMLSARTFSVRSRRVPAWVGLLALLEDFVVTWDPVRSVRRRGAANDGADPPAEDLTDASTGDPAERSTGDPADGPIVASAAGSTGAPARVSPVAPKRPGDPIYSRAGWRCTAPGCTSRKNLDDHHLVYRSRRGGNALDNRDCICRFHHYQGEHGELASCRGKAPLGILWRLGKKELGVWYRNERRVVAPTSGSADGSADGSPSREVRPRETGSHEVRPDAYR